MQIGSGFRRVTEATEYIGCNQNRTVGLDHAMQLMFAKNDV
jgi:hypothetical protein